MNINLRTPHEDDLIYKMSEIISTIFYEKIIDELSEIKKDMNDIRDDIDTIRNDVNNIIISTNTPRNINLRKKYP